MRAPVPLAAKLIGAYHVVIGGMNLLVLALLLIAVFSTALVAPTFLAGGIVVLLFSLGFVFFAGLHISVGVGLCRGNRAALIGAIVLSGLLALGGLGVGTVEGEAVGIGSAVFHGAMTLYLLFSKEVHAAFGR